MSPAEKKSMIRRDHPDLNISQQCRLVKLSRSAFYYTPVGIDEATLAPMKRIDRAFAKYPFFGSRRITAWLRREGGVVGRHRVRRLMAKMGLEAICKRPRTGQPNPQHPVWPYLLRKMQIDRPNRGWCADIAFIPVKRGYLYLVAIMDWATRKVLSWRLSNTMHADFCVKALKEAIDRFGPPEIMNTDQGSQFTGSAWITTLSAAGVRISMDGRGRCMDNPQEFTRTNGVHAFDHRAAVAVDEAGSGLPRGNPGRIPRAARDRQLDEVLQHRAAPFFP